MARTSSGQEASILNIEWGLPYKNVDSFYAEIIHGGKATLQELRTVYSLQDGYDILESDFVPAYNNYLRQKRMAHKAEIRKMFARK